MVGIIGGHRNYGIEVAFGAVPGHTRVSALGSNPDVDTGTLPEDVYENGLSEELEKQWIGILVSFGRIPYIIYPNLCAKCGELWPEMFRVPDWEWQKYVQKNMQDEMLCQECYDYIKEVVDNHK